MQSTTTHSSVSIRVDRWLRPNLRLPALICGFILLFATTHSLAQQQRKTENVIIVTIDGLRWQELFDGADLALLEHRLGGVRDIPAARTRYWRETWEDRRKALMPFFWDKIAKDGQVFGDPGANCEAKLANVLYISYPGYSEMLCGYADARILTNHPMPNPNINVLEFLHSQEKFRGKVAAFCTWDVFSAILNAPRAKFPIFAGWTEIRDEPLGDREKFLNEMIALMPRIWNDNAFDMITTQAAMEYIKKHQPRVFYLSLGETDEWAHARRYDRYLDAAYQSDQYIQQLWTLVQSMPQYAGKTSLVLTTDHGRGGTLADWTDHRRLTPGADRTWIAVMGPDTANLGIRSNVNVTTSQVAATIAALLGENFITAQPRSAPVLPDVMDLPEPRSMQKPAFKRNEDGAGL